MGPLISVKSRLVNYYSIWPDQYAFPSRMVIPVEIGNPVFINITLKDGMMICKSWLAGGFKNLNTIIYIYTFIFDTYDTL